MLQVFRLSLGSAWLALFIITIRAVQELGADKAGDFFIGDMAHPWRAQFNADFSFFLLLIAAWLVWSAKHRALGVIWALLSIIGGGLFTFAYLLIVSFQTGGDVRAIVLGRHFTA